MKQFSQDGEKSDEAEHADRRRSEHERTRGRVAYDERVAIIPSTAVLTVVEITAAKRSAM